MNIDLDIAAILSAVSWPLVVLAILLAYRSKIPALVEGLASQVKLEVAGVSWNSRTLSPLFRSGRGLPQPWIFGTGPRRSRSKTAKRGHSSRS